MVDQQKDSSFEKVALNDTAVTRRPIHLLADSQLFFSYSTVSYWSLLTDLLPQRTKAVYIGANSNDEPQFYELFKEAMKNLTISDTEHVKSSFDEIDKNNLNHADLVLIGGGNLKHGWQRICESGMKDIIIERYLDGAFLFGVSAGAVQMGFPFMQEGELQETLQLVPFLISAHEEKENWENLIHSVQSSELALRGLGIPYGGGVIYHPDNTVEILKKPVEEFEMVNASLKHTLLLPADNASSS